MDLEELRKLETSLWLWETRFNKIHMEQILADDFFEFGRSGRIYSRADTINASRQPIGAILPLKDFSATMISDTVALITYISKVQYDVLEVANRSSIWLKTNAGWRLKFHQGTPVSSDS